MPRWIYDENGKTVPGKRKTFFCIRCGIEVKHRSGEDHSNKYCSYECYWKARQEKEKCIICGKPSQRDKRGDRWWKTCSIKCRKKLLNIRLSGKVKKSVSERTIKS